MGNRVRVRHDKQQALESHCEDQQEGNQLAAARAETDDATHRYNA